MQEIIDLIVNQGLAVVCVAYLIYFQNTTMKEIQNILTSLTTNINNLNNKVDNLEEKTDNLKSEVEKIKK